MDCPCTLKDLWPFGCNLRRPLSKCPLSRGKKENKGTGKNMAKRGENFVNFETLYKCNYSLLEKLCSRTDVDCTLVWRQSKVFKIKELGACITSQVAM